MIYDLQKLESTLINTLDNLIDLIDDYGMDSLQSALTIVSVKLRDVREERYFDQ